MNPSAFPSSVIFLVIAVLAEIYYWTRPKRQHWISGVSDFCMGLFLIGLPLDMFDLVPRVMVKIGLTITYLAWSLQRFNTRWDK